MDGKIRAKSNIYTGQKWHDNPVVFSYKKPIRKPQEKLTDIPMQDHPETGGTGQGWGESSRNIFPETRAGIFAILQKTFCKTSLKLWAMIRVIPGSLPSQINHAGGMP